MVPASTVWSACLYDKKNVLKHGLHSIVVSVNMLNLVFVDFCEGEYNVGVLDVV